MHNIDLLIIESQLQKDIDLGLKEGQTLRDVLAHDGFNLGHRYVKNRKELATLLSNYAKEAHDNLPTRIPAVHIAAHGHDEAISLTDGDQVPWSEFWNMFMVFVDCPLILVGFSACGGFHSSAAAETVPNLPIGFIIGPDTDVIIGDSLIGFSIFYHLLIKKEQEIEPALKCMNEGINGNIFFCKQIGILNENEKV